MGSTRPRGRPRSAWSRVFGYGGSAALVVAAIVVLLMPLLDQERAGSTTTGGQAAGTQAPSSGQIPPAGDPAAPGRQPDPGQPQQNQSTGRSYPGEQGPGQQGGGPPLPGTGGGTGTITWCPVGTALYRQVGGALEVDVKVAGNGFVRAEVTVRGGRTSSQQTTVKGGRLHTFKFGGVSVAAVQRVKITTFTGLATENCYASPGG
ncbi:hypothetical protein [Actinomadura rudentiformis]|uniref:Uncharacterized protein n=1 Tax=Actinomadura rudentiformis TaxID=359158 RepID=A0A6H9YIU2_9ACTN|nr:hypothetical protein [Actinomadura rudentiformis]KAB2341062.1 hypothetical protein F8566_42985 [Actinomadura rudentiformis]